MVSAYKQLAPEGNIWVYTNAVSLIEYSNEELDFIKNNVNILLILTVLPYNYEQNESLVKLRCYRLVIIADFARISGFCSIILPY